MNVETVGRGCNVYRVGDVLVDVGLSADRLPDVDRVLVTHGHVDHVGCLRDYVERSGADVYLHPRERDYVFGRRSVMDRAAREMGLSEAFYDVDFVGVEEGDYLDFGPGFRVLHTPGHTPGSVSFYVDEHDAVFVGDVVSGDGAPGSTAGGDSEALARSIDRLRALDVDVVYPGHGSPLTDDVDVRLEAASSLA
ncbi:MAG: MBL fold metallo-hydrolase [Halobacteriales archaeon]